MTTRSSDYKFYRLSKIIDKNTGAKVDSNMIGKYYEFHKDSLEVGLKLAFRDVNATFGFHLKGEIESIEKREIRKREYTIVSTKIQDFYLLEYQRRDS
ncbi:TPA: hypothetical protein ACORDH_002816 [Bacillus cereus]